MVTKLDQNLIVHDRCRTCLCRLSGNNSRTGSKPQNRACWTDIVIGYVLLSVDYVPKLALSDLDRTAYQSFSKVVVLTQVVCEAVQDPEWVRFSSLD